MPRFQVSSEYTPVKEEDSGPPVSFTAGASMMMNRQSSTRQSCLSPDSRFLHSLTLSNGSYLIESNRLPLEEQGGTERGVDETDVSVKIQTQLPERVQDALRVDPPLELLCVEGQGVKATSAELQSVHKLCLYTEKSAFLLELGYPTAASGGTGAFVNGQVISVDEPFERYLFDTSFSSIILRIRSAPQRNEGYSTVCPSGSVAMLLLNKELSQYSLVLYHGKSNMTTKPLDFGVEFLSDDNDRFVDFCFASSHSLSIFSSLSILLLKGSGDVLAASPILFDGTVVPRTCLEQGFKYLQGEKASLDQSSAKWRQCRAAETYLSDVFGSKELYPRRSHYVTAQLVVNSENSAASWPAMIQGPIVLASATDPGPLAVTIESFGNTDMVGAAIGKQGGNVDFLVLSPTSLLPRFALESPTDGYAIDDALGKLGGLVERVSFGASETTNRRGPAASVSLVRDPVVDTLLHCVTPTTVRTISTNALRIASRQLEGATTEPKHTTAWSCLEVIGSETGEGPTGLQGVVVAGDGSMPHTLIARLDNGSMVTVNVTEAIYTHGVKGVLRGASEQQDRLLTASSTNSTTEQALTRMEATPALSERIAPLVEQITAGLACMGKIVGSETGYKDATPELVAVALQVKKQCDKTIVLPLLELKKIVAAHEKTLKATLEEQRDQLQVVQKTAADLKERMSVLGSKMETLESNALTLTEKSSNIHQASMDLYPAITQAEAEYSRHLDILDNKVKRLEEQIRLSNEALASHREAVKKKDVSVPSEDILSQAELQAAHAALNGNEEQMKVTRQRLKTSQTRMESLIRATGLSREVST